MKNYKEVKFHAGQTIDNALKQLKQGNTPACGKFNGVMLYSDDTLDEAYRKITGIGKDDFGKARELEKQRYEREKAEHEKAIPRLIEEYTKKGQAILAPEYHNFWAEIIPIRLSDIYRGAELAACLEIIDQLNKGDTLQQANQTLSSQDHSGMSQNLTLAMVSKLCERGEDFLNYVIRLPQ